MIIDFHAHCYPDKLAKKAVSIVPKGLPAPVYDGTLKGLKDFIKSYGIDYAVALNIANKPEYTTNVNDWAISCAKEDGIFSFGSVHPLFSDYKAEIARLKEAGIIGLKFHPYYQQCDINQPEAYRVYEEAAKAGLIMLFHTGIDVMLPGNYGTSDKFAAVIDDLKYEKIVGAHLGGSLTVDDAAKYVWGKNIYLDTSLSFRFLSDEQKNRLKNTHSLDKLLFGVDGPWTDPLADFKQIDSFFNKKEKDMIYYNNAASLLGLF